MGELARPRRRLMEWKKNPKRIAGLLINGILALAIVTFLYSFGRRYFAERTFTPASV